MRAGSIGGSSLLRSVGRASAGDEDDAGHRQDEERDGEGADTGGAHLLDGGARRRCETLCSIALS